MPVIKHALDPNNPPKMSKAERARFDAIRDEDIDCSDIPELDEAFFKKARVIMPDGTTKKTVTMRLDQDVFDWYKNQGKGHLTRMNAVLRAYMLSSHPE